MNPVNSMSPGADVTSASTSVTSSGVIPVVSRYRWRICALLFFATAINYMDRQVLGILAPDLQKTIGWNELQYGYLVTAFQTAYAIGILCMGPLIDRIGTRLGYALAVTIWSLSAMGTSLAHSVFGFGFARFMLGLGESGNFPAGIKTVAEWFPSKERAFATGLFNSGTNVGAIIAPLTVPYIAIHLGWRWAFIFTGFFSATWIVIWLNTYRRPQEHKHVSKSELSYIQADGAESTARIPWSQLLPHRQTWAFVIGKFMTDPIWWFFLFWLPKFFNTEHGITLSKIGPPLVVIYLMSDFGSIAGGWASSRLIRRGWTANRARKTVMLGCAIAVVPIISATRINSLWLAVAVISLATAAHQGWSANMFTLASDMFPQRAVGSVVGIGGFGGAVGGMLIGGFTGLLLHWTGSYLPIFVIAGSVYLIALLIIQILVPDLRRANLELSPGSAA